MLAPKGDPKDGGHKKKGGGHKKKGGGHKKKQGSFAGSSSDGSTISLIEREDGLITASVVEVSTGMIYRIFPNRKKEMIVAEMNTNDMPMEEEAEWVLGERVKFDDQGATVGRETPSDRDLGERVLFDDQGGNIDVMVVWTAKAECEQSNEDPGCILDGDTEQNMRALIDLAFQETNEAFAASGVTTILRLVHAYRADVNYVEDGYDIADNASYSSLALNNLRDNGDGVLDEVHTKRTEYGADMVSLFASIPSFCGRAFLGPRKDLMFSVIDYDCATGYYTFGHELGHNWVSLMPDTELVGNLLNSVIGLTN
jgi:hypothetical protein